MRTIFFIIVVITVILILPIPIKLSFDYDENKPTIKIWNKKVHFNERRKHNEKVQSNKTEQKDINKKYYVTVLKKFLIHIKNSKLKPILNIKFALTYSTADAAFTALLYPLINEILFLVCTILKIPFKLRLKDISVRPEYKDNFYIKLSLKCILIINLAKLIYMLLIFVSIFLGGVIDGKSSYRKFNEVNYGKSKGYD